MLPSGPTISSWLSGTSAVLIMISVGDEETRGSAI
jgi:hypothetical protein